MNAGSAPPASRKRRREKTRRHVTELPGASGPAAEPGRHFCPSVKYAVTVQSPEAVPWLLRKSINTLLTFLSAETPLLTVPFK